MPGKRGEPATPEPPGPPASPPCEAAFADDLYMGFAPREELRTACAALLQAERALGRAAAGIPARQAEARACERLAAAALAALGGDADAVTADCEPRADAPGPETWQAGQAALAARLSALLPRVRDDRLHALLSDLRGRHLASLGPDAG
ncbi:MAG: hypothetical protein RIB84_26610 [Sneathiellaceae bacterium]